MFEFGNLLHESLVLLFRAKIHDGFDDCPVVPTSIKEGDFPRIGKILGVSLNMIVLFALTLSLGMLVDNGIVVVENILRRLEEGSLPGVRARPALSSMPASCASRSNV